MRERSDVPQRVAVPTVPFTVDAVIVTPQQSTLGILARRTHASRGHDLWELPWAVPRGRESLEQAARRLVRGYAGTGASWLEQVGAFADGRRHPSAAPLSVCFVAIVPAGVSARNGEPILWFDSESIPALSARQREMVATAMSALRWRMDHAPIPFRLLPSSFTLTDLQQTYELLLGRRLHKASFRRALHAAWLVEPTDEWRSEGRGRPAQLFRFAPRKRRGHRRGVRFDLLHP